MEKSMEKESTISLKDQDKRVNTFMDNVKVREQSTMETASLLIKDC